MATAAAVSPSCVSDKWIVTFSRCSAIAPVSRTRGRPHMSVTTSISRWMPSGSTGRLENRETDHALITASLAAHRAARCRAADELLSAASRRSPGVNVSANTVPGWSTCSANSGIETRSMPTPTMLIRGTLAPAICSWRERSSRVHPVFAEPGRRIEQHLGLFTILRRLVVQPAVACGPLVQRCAARDRRGQPSLPGEDPRTGLLLIGLSLLGIERRDERLRMHQRDDAGDVTEAQAGDQARLQRELLPQPQRLAHPHEVLGAGQLVVDTVQAAVRRDDTVAQHLAHAHHLEHRG